MDRNLTSRTRRRRLERRQRKQNWKHQIRARRTSRAVPALPAQVSLFNPLATNLSLLQRFASFGLLLFVVVCLALIGVASSTASASLDMAALAPRPAITIAVGRPRGPISEDAGSYSRYSSDLQDDSSIEQQQRVCREKAAANGHTIQPDLEFADHAVSGTKSERAGLKRMLDAAHAGKFGVLYFQCLSRLAREFVITLPMLKDLVHRCGIRIISVSEGVDSADPNWELTAMIRGWMHQEYLRVLRAAVLRGQQDAVLRDYSVGDWCFGYGSEPIPGSELQRRGRNPKPRMRYIINAEEARWVRQIFQWFVYEGWKLRQIVRELSRVGAPKDHRSTTPGWAHQYVVGVLRNIKYTGLWPWGLKTNVRDPFTGLISQMDRPPEEVAKYLRNLPHLRLIDDETFALAQGKLDANEAKLAAARKSDGTLRGSTTDQARPRHLLQGIIRCLQCGKAFHVAGADGRYMECSGYKQGICSCKTRLLRQLAAELIVNAVQEAILNDTLWTDAILEMARSSWQEDERQTPNEKEEDDRALRVVEQRIKNLYDQLEDAADVEIRKSLTDRLVERRGERDAIFRRRKERDRRDSTPNEPPTAAWVEAQLQQLCDVLKGDPSQAAEALHSLIGDVTVSPVELPGKKRLALRGTFRMSIRGLAEHLRIAAPPASTSEGVERTILFAQQPPWAALADSVKGLFDKGQTMEEIAVELQCKDYHVAKALAWWHQSRGLPVPDARSCRSRLELETKAKQLADKAKELYDKGLEMQEIAVQLSCNRDTVTAAIAHWHQSRGLEVPDGRHRRKELGMKRRLSQNEDQRDDVA